MITITTKAGVTDIHLEGKRLDILAETMCIAEACVKILAEHMDITTGQALLVVNETVLQSNRKDD